MPISALTVCTALAAAVVLVVTNQPAAQNSPTQNPPEQQGQVKKTTATNTSTTATGKFSLQPAVAHRGTAVTVTGPLEPNDEFPKLWSAMRIVLTTHTGITVTVWNEAILIGNVEAPLVKDGLNYRFTVPPKAELGWHVVGLRKWFGDVLVSGDGGFLVRSDTPEKPEVRPLTFSARYPSEKATTFGLTVYGEGFSSNPTDNRLVREGKDLSAGPPAQAVRCTVESSREIRFDGVPADPGKHSYKVRVGEQTSAEFHVTFSRVMKQTPHAWAFVVAIVVALVLLLAVTLVNRESADFLMVYLQLYLWTTVGVYAYVFICLSQWLVRGDPSLPAPPVGLVLMFFVSSTPAATFAFLGWTDRTDARKLPADKVHFLVWSVVGALAVVWCVSASDPAVPVPLKIPTDYAILMGLSSVAYIGGQKFRELRKTGKISPNPPVGS